MINKENIIKSTFFFCNNIRTTNDMIYKSNLGCITDELNCQRKIEHTFSFCKRVPDRQLVVRNDESDTIFRFSIFDS